MQHLPQRVVIIGLGPVGLAVARQVQADDAMKLVGLIDLDPAKIGKRLVELDPDANADDVTVVDDLDHVKGMPADVAIVATSSYFDRLAPNLRQCVRHGMDVVSSCEEMAWPWLKHPHLADEMSSHARKAGVRLIGTGVNPGFLMDVFPVVLASMLTRVTRVSVVRRVDALTRRRPLQIKIGSGMTTKQFHDLAKQGKIGHMGLGESVVMLAQGLGRHPLRNEVKVELEPVIADARIESAAGRVEVGAVCGMRNIGRWNGHGLEIELDLTMALGLKDAKDEAAFEGSTPLKLTIPGGMPGDTATVAALVNVTRHVKKLAPGLRTMLDMPPVGTI